MATTRPPKAWTDPCTLSSVTDPYVASDGVVYDRDTLEEPRYFGEDGLWLSPVTRERLRPTAVSVWRGDVLRLYTFPAHTLAIEVDYVKAGDRDAAVASFIADLAAAVLPRAVGLRKVKLCLLLREGRRIEAWPMDPAMAGWSLRLAKAFGLCGHFSNPTALASAFPVLQGDDGREYRAADPLETHFYNAKHIWAYIVLHKGPYTVLYSLTQGLFAITRARTPPLEVRIVAERRLPARRFQPFHGRRGRHGQRHRSCPQVLDAAGGRAHERFHITAQVPARVRVRHARFKLRSGALQDHAGGLLQKEAHGGRSQKGHVHRKNLLLLALHGEERRRKSGVQAHI